MTKFVVHVGIDVAKDFVDAAIADDEKVGPLHVATDEDGLNVLAAWLVSLGPSVLVGLEASGGYERRVMQHLQRAGIAVRLVDPARVRQFARALGVKAKNDKLDASMIAAFVATVEGAVTISDPLRAQIREYVQCRRQLLDAITANDNQNRLVENPDLKAMAAERRALLRRQIDDIEHRIVALIDAEPTLSKIFALLLSVPGCGPVLSWTLIAEMPELGNLNRWKLAALAGVAPFDRDSGGHNGKRTIYGGRADVRKVLYMAALAATRSNPVIHRFNQRLLHNGKQKKVALTACMRKLLIILNAIVRDQIEWKHAT